MSFAIEEIKDPFEITLKRTKADDEKWELEQYSCNFLLENKLKAENVKTTGIAFTIIGTLLFIAGAGLSMNGKGIYYTRDASGNESGTVQGGAGGLFIGIGIPLIIPGIIMTAVGKHNIRKYNKMITEKGCMESYQEYKQKQPIYNKRKFGGL
jgi:hypothetical protein